MMKEVILLLTVLVMFIVCFFVIYIFKIFFSELIPIQQIECSFQQHAFGKGRKLSVDGEDVQRLVVAIHAVAYLTEKDMRLCFKQRAHVKFKMVGYFKENLCIRSSVGQFIMGVQRSADAGKLGHF